MLLLPSILLTAFATWMATRGGRAIAIVSWILAVLFLFGAMSYHMDDVLKIDL